MSSGLVSHSSLRLRYHWDNPLKVVQLLRACELELM